VSIPPFPLFAEIMNYHLPKTSVSTRINNKSIKQVGNLVVGFLLLLLVLFLLSACTTAVQAPVSNTPETSSPKIASSRQDLAQAVPISLATPAAPAAPREFRAAWVSTVSNIDWPSRSGLSSEQQQAEIIAILDQAKAIQLNAIILQVRPSADAIYPSTLEPWSEYLTGEQGRAPQVWYDPLQFWITQAHQRGLELHAWFNPYRVKTALSKANLSPQHLSKKIPSAVKKYGDLLWMDPSDAKASTQTLNVILDVVRRYDIDGVHIDDYFYPYPIKNAAGQEVDFPDEENWARYQNEGGALSRADWRRQHVNRFVENIAHQLRQEKSWVKFGISPFGIGRPDRLPPGITGFSQYDKLYADVELWLARGWLDYLAPQLYWPIEQQAQAFRVLQDYWTRQNTMARHVWPGLYTSRIDQSDKSWTSEEILNQISITRAQASAGHIHFSMVALMQNRKDIAQRLRQERYLTPALVPATPWLFAGTVTTPRLIRTADPQRIEVAFDDQQAVRSIAIWRRYEHEMKHEWIFSLQHPSAQSIDMSDDLQLGKLTEVVVSLVDRVGQESQRAHFIK
jgi:uncharacterized lipoprotein YddW (UPF0748 family)